MNVTPKALEGFKNLLNNNEDTLSNIRIFASQGCCGPALKISLVEKAMEGDKEITIESVKFLIESSAEEMLQGVTVDYGENGFKLDGLKRSSGCCG